MCLCYTKIVSKYLYLYYLYYIYSYLYLNIEDIDHFKFCDVKQTFSLISYKIRNFQIWPFDIRNSHKILVLFSILNWPELYNFDFSCFFNKYKTANIDQSVEAGKMFKFSIS